MRKDTYINFEEDGEQSYLRITYDENDVPAETYVKHKNRQEEQVGCIYKLRDDGSFEHITFIE